MWAITLICGLLRYVAGHYAKLRAITLSCGLLRLVSVINVRCGLLRSVAVVDNCFTAGYRRDWGGQQCTARILQFIALIRLTRVIINY